MYDTFHKNGDKVHQVYNGCIAVKKNSVLLETKQGKHLEIRIRDWGFEVKVGDKTSDKWYAIRDNDDIKRRIKKVILEGVNDL